MQKESGPFAAYEYQLTLPPLIWMFLFFLIPILIIFAMAFKNADIYGGIGNEWTFTNIKKICDPVYFPVFWRTIWMSFITTIACLIISLPAAYYLARVKKKIRDRLLILIVVPFWTNFLIRIFAWKFILHPDGFIKNILVSFAPSV